MALLPYPDWDSMDPVLREQVRHFEKDLGRPSLLRRMAAWFPPALNVLDHLYHPFMEQGQLSRELKELIVVATSHARGCAYCAGGHSRFLVQDLGLSREFVEKARTGEAVKGLTDNEHALVRFSLKLATDTNKLVPEDIETLKRHGWTVEQIMEAVAATMLSAFTNTLAMGLKLDEDVEVSGYF